jgi:hypothetical protein
VEFSLSGSKPKGDVRGQAHRPSLSYIWFPLASNVMTDLFFPLVTWAW